MMKENIWWATAHFTSFGIVDERNTPRVNRHHERGIPRSYINPYFAARTHLYSRLDSTSSTPCSPVS